MATFVSHLTHDLSQKVVPPASSPSDGLADNPRKQQLQSLFLDINKPLSTEDVQKRLRDLDGLAATQLAGDDEEELALRQAVISKLAVELYGQALDTFFREASDAENELEWWNDIERSRTNLAMYLLQTLPVRILNLVNTVIAALRRRNIPVHLSAFTPSSLRQLFPSGNTLQPNTLTIALFPHLQTQPYSIALTAAHFPSPSTFTQSPREGLKSAVVALFASVTNVWQRLAALVTLPFELTKQECRYKQEQLRAIRDERAEALGTLAHMRDALAAALDADSLPSAQDQLARFAATLARGVSQVDARSPSVPVDAHALAAVAHTFLPAHAAQHAAAVRGLARPSRLTLLWPRLLLLPPLALFGVRAAYASRASLAQMARDAGATVRAFWEGWLLEPLRGVVSTVRAGRGEGVIVTRESVKADLDSLERMTLALAREKLQYDAPRLEALSAQVQRGDLTAVMQIYEEDIKSPVRSVVGGTLLRSLFIQVQKAKVDIDQALAGIDKLLKSQELTFAFVGVAPALALVYAAGGLLARVLFGAQGRGRYGGAKRRAGVFAKMRRIERILIAQPRSRADAGGAERVPALTAGLLLLALGDLRAYAGAHLPAGSRVREGFLEDVRDLEDPALGRAEKMRVVERMWRCWAGVLGWGEAAGR